GAILPLASGAIAQNSRYLRKKPPQRNGAGGDARAKRKAPPHEGWTEPCGQGRPCRVGRTTRSARSPPRTVVLAGSSHVAHSGFGGEQRLSGRNNPARRGVWLAWGRGPSHTGGSGALITPLSPGDGAAQRARARPAVPPRGL